MAGIGNKRKLTPDEEKDVYLLKIKGVNIVEIAFKFGISTRTVERICKRVEEELGKRRSDK